MFIVWLILPIFLPPGHPHLSTFFSILIASSFRFFFVICIDFVHKLLWDFNIQADHLIPARRPDLKIINKEERISKIVDFAVPADNRINLKECAKKDKYIDLAREVKKLWNMNVVIVPIMIGALGTITKGLLKGLEDLEVGARVETIQMTALQKTARILKRILKT